MSKYSLCVFLFLVACVNPEFAAVRGKDADFVRAEKGEPVSVLHENGYEMWTYRQGECRQMVFFNEERRAVEWAESEACRVSE